MRPKWLPQTYRLDNKPPYQLRIFLPEFAELDPESYPWKEMRKHPDNYPDVEMSKVASARTVAGMKIPAAKEPIFAYIKKSHREKPLHLIFRRWYQPKELTEFQLGLQFRQLGIQVPEPLFYAEKNHDTPHTRYYVTRALSPQYRSVRKLTRSGEIHGAKWAERLGAFARDLHNRQVFHADFRTDHIFFKTGPDRHPLVPLEWALIDLDGSFTGRPIPRPKRIKTLILLAKSFCSEIPDSREDILTALAQAYDHDGQFRITGQELLRAMTLTVASPSPQRSLQKN